MEEIIKTIIDRLIPQITSGVCWPRYAIVTGIADSPVEGGLCDDFRPMYAVDIQLLNDQGEPDKTIPPLLGVPVSMPAGGTESGILSLPKEGTQVVIQFLNGLPHKPVITAVLPSGLSLAKCGHGESIWQGSPGAYQSADESGNWKRTTRGTISDQSYKREVQAYETKEQYRKTDKTILEDEKKLIGGNQEQTIAGKMNIAAAGDISIQGASNLILSAASKLQLIAGQDYEETTKGKRTLKATQLYIGDQTDNILQLILELMTATSTMAISLQMHSIAQEIEILKIKLIKMLQLTD